MPTTLLLAHPDLKTSRHLCKYIFRKKGRSLEKNVCDILIIVDVSNLLPFPNGTCKRFHNLLHHTSDRKLLLQLLNTVL